MSENGYVTCARSVSIIKRSIQQEKRTRYEIRSCELHDRNRTFIDDTICNAHRIGSAAGYIPWTSYSMYLNEVVNKIAWCCGSRRCDTDVPASNLRMAEWRYGFYIWCYVYVQRGKLCYENRQRRGQNALMKSGLELGGWEMGNGGMMDLMIRHGGRKPRRRVKR